MRYLGTWLDLQDTTVITKPRNDEKHTRFLRRLVNYIFKIDKEETGKGWYAQDTLIKEWDSTDLFETKEGLINEIDLIEISKKIIKVRGF